MLEGETPHTEHLDAHGEGPHHVRFRVSALEAKIEELEDSSSEVASRTKGPEKGGRHETVEALGLKLSSVTPKLKKKFSLEKDAKGVVVTEVDESGPAAEKGILAAALR